MASGSVFIEGIALWAPRLPGWPLAARILRGELPPAAGVSRPAPAVLPANERRRAPDTVAVALEVAAAACAHAERAPSTLPSVFASAYGDLAISDYLCATLARTPLLTSPTKFHNSVHNAAAGYWAIATGCFEPYTAVAAQSYTFASGLLLAAAQACADERPVLYVAYDTAAVGPLATMAATRSMLGAALVLAPGASARALTQLTFRVHEGTRPVSGARAANAVLCEGSALAPSLALFEALADAVPRDIFQSLGPQLTLDLRLEPREQSR
ncbi:MAG TPA: beta-ketoacyl synthase chain length factor [Steroidobacteraceae bacterium]|nr:beta-ketoacyl synthase chain length factor [Steroidobacteraceae bacterium]